MFIRRKGKYFYVVQSYRNADGEPRQRVRAYLGRCDSLLAAIDRQRSIIQMYETIPWPIRDRRKQVALANKRLRRLLRVKAEWERTKQRRGQVLP